MTRQQLRQIQHNHRGRRPVAVLGAPSTARWLEQTARQVQALEDARSAWRRWAPAGLFEETRVVRFRDGVLQIAVAGGAALFELRRRAAHWRQTLGPYVRGLGEVRFIPGDPGQE